MSADTRTLGDLGERGIYAELLKPRYEGLDAFGDDCAALGHGLVVTTDSCPAPLLESLGRYDPFATGWLLGTINLSDLAAAAARPLGLVVNYTLPHDTPVTELDGIMQGVDACAAAHGTKVFGGDLRDGREVHLSATAVGRCLPPGHHPRYGRTGGRWSRRGARAGDRLLVVGSPGYLWGAALLHHGWATVSDDERDEVFARARCPRAQLPAAHLLARRGLVRAALDLSDGLYSGTRALCDANGLGAVMTPGTALDPVLERICEQAKVSTFQLGATWGDWCLLVAVRPGDVTSTCSALRRARIGVREVGRLTAETGVRVDDGGPRPPVWHGTDQERFSRTSWHGTGVDEQIRRMRESTP